MAERGSPSPGTARASGYAPDFDTNRGEVVEVFFIVVPLVRLDVLSSNESGAVDVLAYPVETFPFCSIEVQDLASLEDFIDSATALNRRSEPVA